MKYLYAMIIAFGAACHCLCLAMSAAPVTALKSLSETELTQLRGMMEQVVDVAINRNNNRNRAFHADDSLDELQDSELRMTNCSGRVGGVKLFYGPLHALRASPVKLTRREEDVVFDFLVKNNSTDLKVLELCKCCYNLTVTWAVGELVFRAHGHLETILGECKVRTDELRVERLQLVLESVTADNEAFERESRTASSRPDVARSLETTMTDLFHSSYKMAKAGRTVGVTACPPNIAELVS